MTTPCGGCTAPPPSAAGQVQLIVPQGVAQRAFISRTAATFFS